MAGAAKRARKHFKNNKAVVGSTVPGGPLGDKRKVIKGALGPEVVLGPALVFTEKNISQYKF